MKENKILFIANKAPQYRIPLFNELAKRLNIKFVFTHEDKKIKELKADYELVKGVGYKKYKIHFSLINILRKEKPSKVVMLPPDPLQLIDNIFVSEYLKKKKIPFFIVVGRWKYKEKPLKQKITELFHKKILKNAECCLAYGSKSKDWLLEQGVKEKNIEIIYNINPHIYENFDEKKKKLLEFKNTKVILYVGRLLKIKGVDYLIKAFSELKDKSVVLVLVGGGDFYNLGAKSEEKELKDLIKKLRIEKRVVFTGHLLPEKTKKYYKSADIFICPSITYKQGEAWGHVVEEAMSFGLPVIATDAVGAAYDLIENGKNGFIVPEKNINALRNAIEKILRSKKLKDNLGKESKKIIKSKRFSFKNILEKWRVCLK